MTDRTAAGSTAAGSAARSSPARSAVSRPRTRVAYECDACGHRPPKWVGRCPECGEWGSIVDSTGGAGQSTSLRSVTPRAPLQPARPIATISADPARFRPTGVAELDRVLGGGLVPGAVVLLAGEPGVGKSTLLLDVAQHWAVGSAMADALTGAGSGGAGTGGAGTGGAGSGSAGPAGGAAVGPALVISGEESASQVRLRAERLGALHDRLYLAAETDLESVLGHLDAVKPGLLVVDSVQTISAPGLDGVPGGVNQVRAVTATLVAVAKERGIATVLVGHVTKDGQVAGPRVLEHLVDVVLHFEGDRHSSLRMVRGMKNRFGPADEVGCFEMHEGGIASLPDPSGLFITRFAQPRAGACLTVTMEGRRALVAEVQALIGAPVAGSPRRTVSGLDSARLAMVLAVLQRAVGLTLHDREVYAATVGGIRVIEPAADLGVALAVTSAWHQVPFASDLLAIGEIGLTGEVRRVGAVARRLSEAARLGFRYALVPPGCGPAASGPAPADMVVREVDHLTDAVSWAARITAEGEN